MDSRYEVFTDRRGEARFRLVAANEEPVAQSESYADKAKAARGARDAAYASARAAGLPDPIASAIALTVEVVDAGFAAD